MCLGTGGFEGLWKKFGIRGSSQPDAIAISDIFWRVLLNPSKRVFCIEGNLRVQNSLTGRRSGRGMRAGKRQFRGAYRSFHIIYSITLMFFFTIVIYHLLHRVEVDMWINVYVHIYMHMVHTYVYTCVYLYIYTGLRDRRFRGLWRGARDRWCREGLF